MNKSMKMSKSRSRDEPFLRNGRDAITDLKEMETNSLLNGFVFRNLCDFFFNVKPKRSDDEFNERQRKSRIGSFVLFFILSFLLFHAVQ